MRGRDTVESTSVEDIHGGSGTCHVRQLLGEEPRLPDVPEFSEDFNSDIEFLHETALEPGASIGFHPHEGSEEIYFIMEGTGKMTIDDETAEVGPGDVTLTKNGSKHSLNNTGDENMVILVIEASVEE